MSAPLLAGRYRLDERLAVGGMGEVWRGEDVLLTRPVAVKQLKPEFVGDEDFRARFRAEARHAGRLSHPGIASVYDFGESPDSAWLVLELVEGEPLSATLRRERVLPVERTLDVVAQTASALQAAHDGGVVHRDVKPGNLLLRPDDVVKVTDFGIASATDAVPLTRTGHVIGTAYYLSPEQAAGRSGSPASDLYALGVVAYECLTGSRPFPGDNPVAVALAHLRSPVPPLPAQVPTPVREMVQRLLAKDPAERFSGAAEVAERAVALRRDVLTGALPAVGVTRPAGPTAHGTPGAGQPADALAVTDLLDVVPVAAATPVPEPRRPAAVPGSRARSSRHAVSAAAGVLAVLAVGLGLRSLSAAPELSAAAAPEPVAAVSPSASPPPSAEPQVDTAAWVGKPAVEARAALAESGLVPRLAYDGTGSAVGTVSAVEPSGRVDVGSPVLLHVVPAPAPAPPVAVAPAPAPVVAEQPKPQQRSGGKNGKAPARGKK